MVNTQTRALVAVMMLTVGILMSCAAKAQQTVNVTIDVSNIGDSIPFALGHNVAYYRDAGRMWDPTATVPRLKPSALDAIRYAGIRRQGLVRFPKRSAAEDYRWRRGVGDIAHRPLDAQTYQPNQRFGTDELMKFIFEMNSDESKTRTAKPLIAVNWWYYVNPSKTA